jgi:polar amino acid transport system substrate-binding protein
MLFLWNRKLNALNQKLSEANQKLAELSILDGLTGVGNRKHFDQTYEQSFRWCQRHQVGFAVAMIDIDHFKVVNDTWGHKIGDDCLVALGECLKAHARRETDHIARIGGEEFVVYETYESEKDTVARFEKLRTEVEKIKINTDDEVISFTLSIGLATGIPNQVDSPEDFMKCADRALYEGKRNGRNRVVHDPIIHA